MKDNVIGYFEYVSSSDGHDHQAYRPKMLNAQSIEQYIKESFSCEPLPLENFSSAFIGFLTENILHLYPDVVPEYVAYKLQNADGYDLTHGSTYLYIIIDKVTGYCDTNSNRLVKEVIIKAAIPI